MSSNQMYYEVVMQKANVWDIKVRNAVGLLDFCGCYETLGRDYDDLSWPRISQFYFQWAPDVCIRWTRITKKITVMNQINYFI